MTDTMTELELDIDLAPFEDTDDGNEHHTHIVNPPRNLHIWTPGMSSREMVEIARMTGQEVVALCGYRWVPKRNPEKYEACKTCMDIAHQLMREAGE